MTFDQWFEANKDKLSSLLRGDALEALYEAWLAGYKSGLDEMADFTKELWR